MGGRGIGRLGAAIVMALVGLCVSVGNAWAGGFTLVTCQGASAKQQWSSEAFQSHATSWRMKVVRACSPSTTGEAGLLTGNVKRAGGGVPRGDVARVWMDAPPGDTFTSVEWQGKVKRGDCRYAMQIWAEGIPPTQANPTGVIPIKNFRARCNKRMTSAYHVDSFHVTIAIPGATRIVQRVICIGAKGRGCSASRSNYIVTRFANATVEDTSRPVVS